MTDILIVEDNEELGALIRDFLIRDGFTVVWKTTGEEGLIALKEEKFRLMLLTFALEHVHDTLVTDSTIIISTTNGY